MHLFLVASCFSAALPRLFKDLAPTTFLQTLAPRFALLRALLRALLCPVVDFAFLCLGRDSQGKDRCFLLSLFKEFVG